MYGVVITSHVQPDNVDEAISIIHELVIPSFKTVAGVQSWRAFVDRGSGKLVAIARYNSEEQAQAVGGSIEYRHALAALMPLLVGQPTREIYEEVAVFEA